MVLSAVRLAGEALGYCRQNDLDPTSIHRDLKDRQAEETPRV